MEEAGLQPPRPETIAGHEDNVGENILIPLLEHAGFSMPNDTERSATP